MFLARAARFLRRQLPAVLILFIFAPSAFAQNIYQQLETPFYDPNSISNNCAANLPGSDNEEQVWNYFISKGLSSAQTAGVMGNLQQESGFDPERVQNGGNSQTPPDTPGVGWGLAQWTPGTKANDEVQKYSINGPIYELPTQLDLIWAEMTNVSPTGVNNMVANLQQINDPALVASNFVTNFEGGTDPNNVRETNAQNILTRYGGSSVDTSASSSCVIGDGTDCTTVNGNAKILCEAEKYQGIYYRWGGGHQGYSAFIAGCQDPSNPPDNQSTGSAPDPTDHGLSGNPSPCATDCTGLVSVAVDEAFNLNYMWTVNGAMQGDGAQYWKSIPISSAAAGDIVTTPEHVEIVDHVSGSTIFTFGSHETGERTGLTTSDASSWTTGAWQWTGPGSGQ